MWYNKYVGLPFKLRGRSYSGVDCWGLARLVYKEKFDITLPSFEQEYDTEKSSQVTLADSYKDYWDKIDAPVIGCIVLFRILGGASHVGIYVGNGKFLHAKTGQLSAVERLDSIHWRNRVVGYYKYSQLRTGSVTSVPHALRTERFTLPIPEGTTVSGLTEHVIRECEVPEELRSTITILVNGKVDVPADYVLKDTDVVEYRSVPAGDALKFIAIIALAVYAPYLAASIVGPTFGIGAVVAVKVGLTVAINAIGMLLLNAIFPPVIPKVKNPGVSENQLLVNGGSNSPNKYGAIPVVLGKIRMTPPLGAQTYSESNDKDSYLRMLLVWGFGPLAISDLRIGNTSIDQYQNAQANPVEVSHLGTDIDVDDSTSIVAFNSIYPSDVQQNYVGVKLVNNAGEGNPWIESTFTQTNISKLSAAIHFPQGLRAIDKENGDVKKKSCLLEVEYRKIPLTGDPGSWVSSTRVETTAESVFRLEGPNYIRERTNYGFRGTTTTVYYYRWYSIGIRTDGTTFVKRGALTENPALEPSAALLGKQKSATYAYASNSYFSRLPTLESNEILLYDICLFGEEPATYAISTSRRDTAKYSFNEFNVATRRNIFTSISTELSQAFLSTNFGGITPDNFSVVWNFDPDAEIPVSRALHLDPGIVSASSAFIELGLDNYVKRKNAFTHNVDLPITEISPSHSYQIRVRRLSSDAQESGGNMNYHEAQFLTATAHTVGTPPIKEDLNRFRLARSAIRIRATNQLNSQIEGINALVQTICLDYGNMYKWVSSGDVSSPAITKGWRMAATNNPASLFRYVLEHEANARRLSKDGAKINLAALEDWHEFCAENNYTYNSVIMDQRSVLDVLREIAAAGKASPAMVDGKWTVIIDRPRTEIVQHFTPHNSWGFEATKALPRIPDGIKVTFNNQDRGYQEEEVIVYNEGKSDISAEVFEQLTLPGVTDYAQVQEFARWHLAQAKLRPEVYSLHTDIEYLVCNRGDRVKVQHDVTLWGLGSGRVHNVPSADTIELDEPQYLEVGKIYSLRIRTNTGGSVVLQVAGAISDDIYSSISIIGTVPPEVEPGCLFIFGEVNRESEDLVVLSVEPFGNHNAKITLNNYSESIYDVNYLDTITSIPEFDTNITLPPKNLVNSITETPTITKIVSDESVTTKTAGGDYRYAIYVAFTNPTSLKSEVDSVELAVDIASDDVYNWQSTAAVKFVGSNSVRIEDVYEGETYNVKLRYVARDGRTGPWTEVTQHTVVGKSNPPANISSVTALPSYSGVTFSWAPAPDIDVTGYEVRVTDTGWGDPDYLYRGESSYFESTAVAPGTSVTVYIKAYDVAGNYSTVAQSFTYTPQNPGVVSNIVIEYPDPKSQSNTATLSWAAPAKTSYDVSKYVVTIGAQNFTSTGTSLQVPVTWADSVTVQIVAYDTIGGQSSAASTVLTRAAVPPVSGIQTKAISSGGVTVTWSVPTGGDLPVAGYEIRSTASGAGTSGFNYRVSANSVDIIDLAVGSNTYYIWAYDTSGKYSTSPASISFSTTAPNAVTGIGHSFNSSSATASSVYIYWNTAAEGMYDITSYEVTLSYSSPVPNIITSTRNTTDWEVQANWIGNATVSVKTIDILGQTSTAATYVINKLVPNTPDSAYVTPYGTQLAIDWPDTVKTSLPVVQYEIRTTDSGWGSGSFVWKGSASNAVLPISPGIGTKTWYLKAIDSDGKYSSSARSVTYTVTAPGAPAVAPAEFEDTSLTSATVTLYWSNVEPVFGLKGYEVTYEGETELVDSTTITLAANWVGDRTFSVKTVDLLGNKSDAATIVATKLPPDPVSNFRAQVIDNNVLLYWNLPTKTTLPISHVVIKKGSTWATAELIGNKDGSFTSLSELVGAEYTYWIAVVDTDNIQSVPVSLVAMVAQPPDFVFNAEYVSTFSSTSVYNCARPITEYPAILLPVSNTETFADHFTTRGWTSPSSQVSAGYPIYIQPGEMSGYYEETFDYGTILGSSQITVVYIGNNVVGNVTISPTISISTDGVSYTSYTGSSSIFGTNFRFVKVRMEATQQTPGSVFEMTALTVRLDAKQRNDSGTVAALASDTEGTIVNFSTEFIDVIAITLTPLSTVPRNAVYDLKDYTMAATYSIVSNVCTVTLTSHGLSAGQNIRAFFSSGAGVNGVYTIQSVPNANTLTFNIVAPNTSGNISMYPNSIKVYLFDTAGTRVSGTVSWSLRGY